jgi:hypothetical protein
MVVQLALVGVVLTTLFSLVSPLLPCLRDEPFSQHDFLRSRAPMHLPL